MWIIILEKFSFEVFKSKLYISYVLQQHGIPLIIVYQKRNPPTHREPLSHSQMFLC